MIGELRRRQALARMVGDLNGEGIMRYLLSRLGSLIASLLIVCLTFATLAMAIKHLPAADAGNRFAGPHQQDEQEENETGRRRLSATGKSVALRHAGLEREYRIHVPDSCSKNKLVPLVVCLHGGGGNSTQASRMGMSKVADQHGFIAVYPNAINKHWADGRDSPRFAEHDQTIDDVAFIMAVVERVSRDYKIDPRRVFATGVSNGGFMTQRMAIEHPRTFSAVAVVIASMGEPLKEDFDPSLPVSVMYLNGTDDPLVPYEGGEVGIQLAPKIQWRNQRRNNQSRGQCISTNEAAELWVKRNRIESKPVVTELPDNDATDECRIQLSLWEGGEAETAVAIYKVIGGGHTVPGMIQYLPERLVGRTNRDIDGFETIWKFFEKYNRNPEVQKKDAGSAKRSKDG